MCRDIRLVNWDCVLRTAISDVEVSQQQLFDYDCWTASSLCGVSNICRLSISTLKKERY